MSRINAGKNKAQMLQTLSAEIDRLEQMDEDCFIHCGWQIYMNNGEKKKDGQDTYSSWYKGQGGSTNPPPSGGG